MQIAIVDIFMLELPFECQLLSVDPWGATFCEQTDNYLEIGAIDSRVCLWLEMQLWFAVCDTLRSF